MFMQEKQFSQGELSRRINIQQTAVSKWLRGETMPEADTLVNLSNVFDCEVDYLLNREKIN